MATGGGQLVLLAITPAGLVEAGARQLPAEVACVDISPLAAGAEAAAVAGVGTWDKQLLLLGLPGLQDVAAEALGGEVGVLVVVSFDWGGVCGGVGTWGCGHLGV